MDPNHGEPEVKLIGDLYNTMLLDEESGNLHVLRQVERYRPEEYWGSNPPPAERARDRPDPQTQLPLDKSNLLTLYGLVVLSVKPFYRHKTGSNFLVVRVMRQACWERLDKVPGVFNEPLLLDWDDSVEYWHEAIREYVQKPHA
jgi:hypothetical protein